MNPKSLAKSLLLLACTLAACDRSTANADPATPPKTTQTSTPSTPSTPKEIKPGILFSELALTRAGTPMKLWIYLPARHQGKLPCLLIAPAGSRLFHGMTLGSGDQAEHLPYVEQGFAVVAYEIDGPLNTDRPTNAQLKTALQQFKAANAGVANARAALDYITDKCPDIDPARIFAAGHSSAATLALQVAASDHRVAGVIAYAPCCNVLSRMLSQPGAIGMLEKASPGIKEFLNSHSPNSLQHQIKCPVFLFSAYDDTNIRTLEVSLFADSLKAANPDVKLSTTSRGGHYDSMIKDGIPRALDWLNRRRTP